MAYSMWQLKNYLHMKLKLLFFGALTDVVSNQQYVIDAVETNVSALDASLKSKHPFLNNYKYKIAVNQQIVEGDHSLKDGDEVAFLPPFAGG